MKDLTEAFLELIRLTATDLPADIEQALKDAEKQEEQGSAASGALEAILRNVDLSRRGGTPICQDTGTPIFFVSLPDRWSLGGVRKDIEAAVAEATRLSYLRPNAVNALTQINTGNNLGDAYFPTVHFRQAGRDALAVDLLLKGGGCENVGAQYALPDLSLGAGRDLEGVRRCVLHAIQQAQGQGCAPGILGVAIGGDRGSGYEASKDVLLRKLPDLHSDSRLGELEKRITAEANELEIGPMGFGGRTTVLATKIAALHRLPASYFVTVSYMCWACRRRRLTIDGNHISWG